MSLLFSAEYSSCKLGFSMGLYLWNSLAFRRSVEFSTTSICMLAFHFKV